MNPFQKKLAIGLLVMALLSPLGIILPRLFNAGSAWGEWGPAALQGLLGYVPEGFRKYAGLWKAPAGNYNLGGEHASASAHIISYIISAIAGILIVGFAIFLIAKLLDRHGK